jgi:hypothetical protein
MGYFRSLVENMNDLVFGTKESVAEGFTAEVNQELLQQLKEKDEKIEELKGLIARLCYSTLESVNEAIDYFEGDEDFEEWVPEEEDEFDVAPNGFTEEEADEYYSLV